MVTAIVTGDVAAVKAATDAGAAAARLYGEVLAVSGDPPVPTTTSPQCCPSPPPPPKTDPAMFLARVIGSVVSTKKGRDHAGPKTPPATPNAGRRSQAREVPRRRQHHRRRRFARRRQRRSCPVLPRQLARQASGMKTLPVDAAVVGLVDSVEVLGKRLA